MNISFPNIEILDGFRDVVVFPADVDERRISCAVSLEALCDNFEGVRDASLACFRFNRPRIEAKVESLILQDRFEADGSILLRSQDGT